MPKYKNMKEFLNVLRRFVPPYKKYLVLSVVFNILSAVLKRRRDGHQSDGLGLG